MEYISSDTNVWIDFQLIDRLSLPFNLPFTYIMSIDAVEDELLSPKDFKTQLLDNGLVPVEYTYEEFELAEQYGSLYPRLSIYDRLALAIAKTRKITLLTGDGALRRAARNEGVLLLGTLGILDLLFQGSHINQDEYIECLRRLQKYNGAQVRLPKAEIEGRLKRYTETSEAVSI